MPELRRDRVQSLDRALDVLEVLGAAGELSAPTTRIVHADTGELGRLLCRHAAGLSRALEPDAAPDRARAGAGGQR